MSTTEPENPNLPRRRLPLGELLVLAGVIDRETLKRALHQQRGKRIRLGTLLVEMGMLTERQLVQALAGQLGLHIADLARFQPTVEALSTITLHLAREYSVLPLLIDDAPDGGSRLLFLAMTDPTNQRAVDAIQMRSGLRVRPVLLEESLLESAVSHYYETMAAALQAPPPPAVSLDPSTFVPAPVVGAPMPSLTLDASMLTPVTSSDTPEVPSLTLDASMLTPVTSSDTPEVPSLTLDASMLTPVTSSDTPEVPSLTLDASMLTPVTSTGPAANAMWDDLIPSAQPSSSSSTTDEWSDLIPDVPAATSPAVFDARRTASSLVAQSPVDQSPVDLSPVDLSPVDGVNIELTPIGLSPIELAPASDFLGDVHHANALDMSVSDVDDGGIELSPIELAPASDFLGDVHHANALDMSVPDVDDGGIELSPIELAPASDFLGDVHHANALDMSAPDVDDGGIELSPLESPPHESSPHESSPHESSPIELAPAADFLGDVHRANAPAADLSLPPDDDGSPIELMPAAAFLTPEAGGVDADGPVVNDDGLAVDWDAHAALRNAVHEGGLVELAADDDADQALELASPVSPSVSSRSILEIDDSLFEAAPPSDPLYRDDAVSDGAPDRASVEGHDEPEEIDDDLVMPLDDDSQEAPALDARASVAAPPLGPSVSVDPFAGDPLPSELTTMPADALRDLIMKAMERGMVSEGEIASMVDGEPES